MSAKRKFTDIAVQRLPEGMHWDASLGAFGLRVGKNRRTWVCVRDGGNRITLGHYPEISLSEARKKAKAAMIGSEPVRGPVAFSDALGRYLLAMEGELKPRTLYEYRSLLRKFSFSLTEITVGEARHALDGIEKLSARSHAYTVLKVMLNWCVQREFCDANPLAKIKKPKVGDSRERVLTDREMAKIWHACEALGKFGAIVRLLMLTGQRKNQIACLREEWIDYDKKVFNFPRSVMKSGREHSVPFAPLAEYVLRGVVPIEGYFFSPETVLGEPFTAWSKSKIKLDKLVDLDPFTLHDLRRTWSTNAAMIGVPAVITARVLSHVSPEGKISAIYNRFKYEKEMRDAMMRMNTFITEIVLADGGLDNSI